jgi:alpha-beta hydrolase superfamily lysophospholipase
LNLKIQTGVLVVFFATLGLLRANFLPASAPNDPLQLMSPSGPFRIGTRIYHWVDRSRHEKASRDPAEFRQLVVQVWYPAKSNGGPTAPYVPQLDAYRKVWTKEEVDLASRTVPHSHLDARPVAKVQFPIVLLSHGWEGTRSEYTSLAEDLASHGYAVFGVDHPYMGRIALPSGEVTEATEDQFGSPEEVLEYYGQDLKFAVDQIAQLDASDQSDGFANRLDLSHIAAIGHSSGFGAVSTACREDERIKACVNVDAPVKSKNIAGMHQPMLWIRLERAGPVPEDFLTARTATVYELRVKGAKHASVEDWEFLQAASPGERTLAGHRLMLIRRYVDAFLEKTLRGQDNGLLKESQTSEIQLVLYRARASGR